MNIKNFFLKLIAVLKDVYKNFILTKCDYFDIIEIIGFGMVVNSLYGLSENINFKDSYVLLLSLFAAIRTKQMKKDEKCLK